MVGQNDIKRKNDDWGQFDEDWSFSVHEIPPEFRTSKKYENFILAKNSLCAFETFLAFASSDPKVIEVYPFFSEVLLV